jgi:hypothetical protein
MILYIFPDESQESIEESDAFNTFLSDKEAGDGFVHLWPENSLTFSQRQKYDPESAGADVVSNDPFIISAFHKRDVRVCYIARGKVSIKKNQPEHETFGSSYDYLLGELFGVGILISDVSCDYMHNLLDSSKRGKTTKNLENLRAGLSNLGESFEKRFLYGRIYELQEKVKKSEAKKKPAKKKKVKK